MRRMSTRAVTAAEQRSNPAHAESTKRRAEDTPVNSDTVTKRLSGTRNNEDSCRRGAQRVVMALLHSRGLQLRRKRKHIDRTEVPVSYNGLA